MMGGNHNENNISAWSANTNHRFCRDQFGHYLLPQRKKSRDGKTEGKTERKEGRKEGSKEGKRKEGYRSFFLSSGVATLSQGQGH